MMIPAIMTPRETDSAVVLMPMSRKLAARVPVHAPVPGMGMPTNSISASRQFHMFAPCRQPRFSEEVFALYHLPCHRVFVLSHDF